MRNFQIIIICLITTSMGAVAQGLSNKGREFWLGYGHNVLFTNTNPPNSQNLVLYLSAEKDTRVTVTINGTAWSKTVNIPAGKVDFSIVIPKTGADDCRIMQEGKFEKGIHIEASEPIVAYAHQYGVFSSAATMLFPVETYGYNYFSVNFTQQSNAPNSYSWMFVVAPENNTKLRITPSDTTVGGILPGETIIVELNKGEIYNLFGKLDGTYTGKDLTGTRVSSIEGADGKCHPVGVFSGSSRLVICSGDGGEVMQQQIFPASAWGTTYLTHHDIKNTGNNVNQPMLNFFRVLVADASTVVKRNGTILTGLTNNRFYQFSSNSGDFIEADQPILVCQYTPSSNQCSGTANPPTGDPEMYILAPLQQGIKSTTFYNTRNQNIDINYVDIIVHKNGLPSLLIDNAPPPQVGIKPHPANSDYVFVAKRLFGAGAQHTIQSDSPFVAKISGQGNFESYGYLAGMLVNNLNGLIKVENEYNISGQPNTFSCPNSPFKLSVRLAYKATSILWAFSKTSGLSVNTDTLLTNPVPADSVVIAGRKYFTYQLPSTYFATTTGFITIPMEAASPEIDYCGKVEKLSLTLEVKPAPRADFNVQYSGCLSDSAALNGTPLANGFEVNRFVWYFDDGSIDSVQSLKKKIPGGRHPVSFRVIADMGCLHDSTRTVTTTLNPVASFSVSDSTVCIGQPVVFTDASDYNGGQITEWHWHTGEGEPLVQYQNQPVVQTYSRSGTFNASLWVQTNNLCKSDTVYQTVTVAMPPVIDAGPNLTIVAGQSVTLQATAEAGADIRYLWIPAHHLSNPELLNPVASPNESTTYTLVATKNGSCSVVDSMQVIILSEVFIPNAFSPNGDGLNDVWKIPGLTGYPNSFLRVFDRYGQVIFSDTGSSRPWDGTRNGKALPVGVYYYILDVGDGSTKRNGSVTLLR
jgi:trimeric autotransporter adhesin